MKCPNDKCKRSDVVENSDSNFSYCKECGTVIHNNKNRH
jgi:transcription initiation factor TFIIIB Brf1 subunit/transcription initiation factor TFIIB